MDRGRYGDRMARPFLKGADTWVLAHAKSMGQDGFVVSYGVEASAKFNRKNTNGLLSLGHSKNQHP